MGTVHLSLDDSVTAVLAEIGPTPADAARDLIVLELFRRAAISGGKAAALLGMSRLDFIQRASSLGIPYITMTEDEWAEEMRAVEEIVQFRLSSPTLVR